MIRSRCVWLTGGCLALNLIFAGVPGGYLSPVAPGYAAEEPAAYVDFLIVKARELLEGKDRDPAAASDLLRQAVQVGSISAMLMLSELYAAGDGVAASFDEANALIEGAMQAGAGASGWLALGDLYRNIDGPEQSAGQAIDAYQQAADLGNTSAMLRLAQVVGNGEGVPVDFGRAKDALQAVIASGDQNAATAWGNLGDLYRRAEGEQRDAAGAVDAYEKALELGNTGVLVVLARMVGEGDGVPADFERAGSHLEQAIARGDANTPWALATLGDLYRNAEGADRDPAKAIEAYEQALELGYTDILVVLARMVSAGDGVAADFDRSRGYLEQAIALGNAGSGWAYASLGDLYRDADETHRDLAKAVEAYQSAIDLGSVDQLVKLARMVAVGDGLPAPDFERARTLLERAVNEDVANAAWAYSALGDLYRDSDEVHRDPAKAVEAYQHAADLDDGGAMLKLARLVGSGEEVPQDFDRARLHLEKAITLHDDNERWAHAMLGDLYRNASEADRDPAKAVAAYERALELGNTDVLIVLARMIGAGDGVSSPKFDEARSYLERAVALGGVTTGWAYASLGDLYRNAAGWRRDPAKAVEAYTKALELGQNDVLVPLARLVGAGDGAPRDFDAARNHLEQAIVLNGSNIAWAYAALGDLYRDATDDRRDLAQAVDAYQHAADLGDTDSMLKLARMFGSGEGVVVDFERARGLLEQIVAIGDQNVVSGWLRLGDLYRDAGGDQRDAVKAIDAYRHAADLGDTTSMIRMARLLGAGDGVPVDFAGARTILEKAISLNDANAVWAWTGLADLYRTAETGVREPAKAAAAYRKAIELGNASALIVLAQMVAAGDGVAADPDEAKALLERASVAGGETAVTAWIALGALHRDQLGAYYDIALALDYYRRAADAGSGAAHLVAAEIESGIGITTGEDRIALARHYQEAGRLLGPEPVARAMYRLDPVTLYTVVQEMLSQADRPISADGIFGKQMQSAIDRFCTAKQIASCGKGLVSFDLLVGLVGSEV